MEFEDARRAVLKFRDDRDWTQFHNPKDLAISISLEAAELLEAFQWSGSDTSAARKEDEVKGELADVLIYCIYLADTCDIDIPSIIAEKLARNARKDPADKARGNSRKYTELCGPSRQLRIPEVLQGRQLP